MARDGVPSAVKFGTIAPVRVASLLIAAALLLPPGVAQAYRRSTVDDDPSGPPLYWARRRIEMRLASGSAPGVSPEDAREAFRASLRTWSLAGGCTDLVLIDGGEVTGLQTNLERTSPDGENRVVFRASSWPPELGPRTLGLTTAVYRRSTGEILDADIDLNAVDHVWSVADVPAAGHDDVQNTITHELGHAIGLAHSDDPTTTMYTRADPEETLKRDLAEDDLWGVCDIYPGGTPRGPRSSCSSSHAQGDLGAWPFLALVALGWLRRRQHGRPAVTRGTQPGGATPATPAAPWA